MGVVVPFIPIVAAFFDQPATYEIFGLSYAGSPFHPMALLISAILISLGISAYGLLFGKPWGLKACLITGYGGVFLCLATMTYSIIALGTIFLRLEIVVLIPYLMKLHKIKPLWSANAI